jgi:predicted dienelactone hydrolase
MNFKFKFWLSLITVLSFHLGTRPMLAAENIVFKVGPLQQSLTINDLEEFAKTGKVPSNLELLSPLFNSNFRYLLNNNMAIDKDLAEQFVNELFDSSQGKNLLDQLTIAIPGSTIDLIKSALILGIRQTNNLNLMTLLKTYPQDTMTIDLTSALGILLQFNASNIQSKILVPKLVEQLEVELPSDYNISFDPTLIGLETVKRRTLILRDSQRERLVLSDIYYANSNDLDKPLILMSHGFAADRKFLEYLASHLASYGFVVAAIEHPGSNIYSFSEAGFNLENLLPKSEFIDRPKDVTFVLNELEKLNKTENYLGVKFNTKKVTILGHSFGGYTAFAVAGGELNPKEMRNFCQKTLPFGLSPADWLQCSAAELPDSKIKLKDDRIKQLIAFNPITGNLFGKSLSNIKIPSLIFASSQDAITPNLDNQFKPFQELGGEKYLAIAFGATHMSITDRRNEKSLLAESTIVKEIIGEEAEPVRNFAKGITLAFIQQLTPEADKYKQFLNASYVQYLSTDNIKLRWTNTIPNSLQMWLNSLGLFKQKITTKPEIKLVKISKKHQQCTTNLAQIFNPLVNMNQDNLS